MSCLVHLPQNLMFQKLKERMSLHKFQTQRLVAVHISYYIYSEYYTS